jgi:L-ectoine synthase
MIVKKLDDIVDTERDVRAETWRSRRLLLAAEGRGYSLHDTVLYAGTQTEMEYVNHVESVYCIEGEGTLVDLTNDRIHPLTPGTLYVLDGHERHRVDAETDLRVLCVFTPPVTGAEVHDANGAYPLVTEESA